MAQPDEPSLPRIDAPAAASNRRQAFRRAVDARREAVAALGFWMAGSSPKPLFLVDGALKPILLNEPARRQLGEARLVRRRGKRLELTDPGAHDELLALLARSAPMRPSSARLYLDAGAVDVTCLRAGVTRSRLYLIAPADRAPTKLDGGTLRRAFRLTHVEAEIAAVLFDGADRPAIAKRRGKSINTVRTQVRTLYAKLGVRSQAGVVRRVSELAGAPRVVLRKRTRPG